jgi:hypothetical protein
VARKSTKDEIQNRVNEVYGLLLRAYSRAQILQYGSEKWEISGRQVDDYIAAARKLTALDAELARPQWLEGALARLQEYERRASDKDQIHTAMVAVEKQARLLRFEMS